MKFYIGLYKKNYFLICNRVVRLKRHIISIVIPAASHKPLELSEALKPIDHQILIDRF